MSFNAVCGTCHGPYALGLGEPAHRCAPQRDHQELTEILTVATAPRLSNAERQKKWRTAHKAQAVAEAQARRAKT